MPAKTAKSSTTSKKKKKRVAATPRGPKKRSAKRAVVKPAGRPEKEQSPDDNAFTSRLRQLYKKSGTSQAKFAARCGVTATAMGRYLSGVGARPGLDVLRRIAKIPDDTKTGTGVSLDWLAFGDGGESAPRYRGESPADGGLEKALAVRVEREVKEHLRSAWPTIPSDAVQVDPERLLRETVRHHREATDAWLAEYAELIERERSAERQQGVQLAVGRAMRAQLTVDQSAALGDVLKRLEPRNGDGRLPATPPPVSVNRAAIWAAINAAAGRPTDGSIDPALTGPIRDAVTYARRQAQRERRMSRDVAWLLVVIEEWLAATAPP